MWINRKASYEYNIEERREAGLVLTGWEVKSIRKNGASLTGAYAALAEGAFWLYKLPISPPPSLAFQASQQQERPKKLLLNRREIRRWTGPARRPGYTVIPLKAYFNDRGILKVEIGLCTGKDKRDKRLKEKEKEALRELREAVT